MVGLRNARITHMPVSRPRGVHLVIFERTSSSNKPHSRQRPGHFRRAWSLAIRHESRLNPHDYSLRIRKFALATGSAEARSPANGWGPPATTCAPR